ncbi:class I SAM-dependent methyltransferase [Kitasatospora cineracea]|uniref:class I SAM-dependent methyltransferase n=1 Tax=Kitasatospora cineracea TaxID=88074 RepID=UPI0036DF77B9
MKRRPSRPGHGPGGRRRLPADRASGKRKGPGVRAGAHRPSARRVAFAAARDRWPGADFWIAGACELPLADGSVDGYPADEVFHELAGPDRGLAEARRVLAPGGRITRSARTGTPSSSTPATRPSPARSCTRARS